jgi:hypothetical protein
MFKAIVHSRFTSVALLFVGARAVIFAPPPSVMADIPGPIDVGAEKQVFIDDRFIQNGVGIDLVVNRPRPTGERLIVQDKPWEDHWIGGYTSVVQVGDRIHVWYDIGTRQKLTGVAYAYSDDGGCSWIKPNLGVVEFAGTTTNNLVILGAHGSHVSRNRPDAPKDEQFMMYCGVPNRLYFSADGIHWKPRGSELVDLKKEASGLPGRYVMGLDSQNVLFWDTRLSRYVFYPRLDFSLPEGWAPGHFLRKFGRMESAGLEKFSRLEIVLEPDGDDPKDVDFYTTAALQYPYAANAYLMFPAVYHHFGSPPHPTNDGPIDIRFATSRDGRHWLRRDRRPLLRLGIEGSVSAGSMYAGYGLSRIGDELSLYYTVYDVTHGAYVERGYVGGIITRAIYRLDGFVSVDAGVKGGEFTTPLLTFDGDRLELNFDGSANGEARIEILDQNGTAVPGFTANDADLVTGNAVAKKVTWNGKGDLSSLRSKPVKLRLLLRDAKLYAFQFVKR